MHLKLSLVFSFIFCFVRAGFAQQEHEDLYLFFDENVGVENTLLFNGIENIDLERTIDEANKYLLPGRDFKNGSLIYDNQFFPKVPMRFNLVDDALIVSINDGGENSVFKLINKKVQQFTLEDRKFVFIATPPNSVLPEGFYQDFYQSEKFKIFKKYLKREFKVLDRSNPYYRYEFLDPEYFLFYDNNYYGFNSNRDVAEIFPSMKKEIRNFYKENRQLRKSNPDAFISQLFTEISRLFSQEKN